MVPFILYGKDIDKKNIKLSDGSLKDIAPTLLDIMQINVPTDMDGVSLIQKR